MTQVRRPLRTPWQRKWFRLDVTHPALQRAADAATNFAARWLKNDTHQSLLVLTGKTGCGKTHIARGLFRFCRMSKMNALESGNWGDHRVPCAQYFTWPEVSSAIREKNFGMAEDAANADMSVLDDIGAEDDPFNTCRDRLCQILSKREKKFTLITTNITPELWAEKFDARICDRLLRNSIVIDLADVESYALQGMIDQ